MSDNLFLPNMLFYCALFCFFISLTKARIIYVTDKSDILLNTTCVASNDPFPKCLAREGNCAFLVKDGVFDDEIPAKLLSVAEKGFSMRETVGGPTILDINTGFLRDSNGLVNLFAKMEEGASIYTTEDFTVYGSVINQLKRTVEGLFGLEELYFTAPTFITRLDGRSSWEPQEDHDVYWNAHVDRDNTAHYHYSGLLYLSDYGRDFEGGRLHLLEEGDDSIVVEPKAGRVVIFSSGKEHRHRVERVTRGQRFVLAFWFTCDPQREFTIYLDGQAHLAFAQKVGSQMNRKRPKEQAGEEL